LCKAVGDHFYDPGFNGLDWPVVRAEYARRVRSVTKDAQFIALMNDLLARLHASHPPSTARTTSSSTCCRKSCMARSLPGIRLLSVWDMIEHVVGDHRIETTVGEWDRLGVELPKAERMAAGLQSLPGLLDHA